ncbi:MAG: hypothetical protein AVDCRST_MAG13-2077, partial [uncultured Solirubrobacteraceae bacterium]
GARPSRRRQPGLAHRAPRRAHRRGLRGLRRLPPHVLVHQPPARARGGRARAARAAQRPSSAL